jgi:DNA-binding transcriptional LysR family regulator
MDFRQLYYFTAALEQLSMSSAARACGVAQPTMSAQIRRLELDINETLFMRTSAGLRPTPAAIELYRRLHPLLQKSAHGLRYLRAGARRPVESLHVAIDYSAASLLGGLIRRAARAMEEKRPHLQIISHGVAPFPEKAPDIRLKHCVADISSPQSAALASDQWLLIEINSGRPAAKENALRLPPAGVIDVPALPDTVQKALMDWCSDSHSNTLKIHDAEATDVIASMLSRNQGHTLVPRLAANPLLLRHPRLRAREVDAGLPPIAVRVDACDPDDPAQRDLIAALRSLMDVAGVGQAPPVEKLPVTRQLRYFLRVADEGSVTRAATKLNVGQPAVSMQIRSLERALQGRIIERSRHGALATDFGQHVIAFYKPILEAMQNETSSRHAKPAPRTILKVGLLPGLDEESLLVKATTATILEWRRRFPNVELKIKESQSGILLDWLVENSIDIAVVEDLHARHSLRNVLLFSEPLAVLVAREKSRLPNGPIRMADLARLDLVLPSGRHGLRALLERHFLAAGLSLNPKLELDSMASAIRLVKEGGWATVLPPSAVARSLESGLLNAHPIIQPAIMRDLRSAQLVRRRHQPWEAGFINILRKTLLSSDKGLD